MVDKEMQSKAAKARWKILAQALKKKHKTNDENTLEYSVRNFGGFDLFDVTSSVTSSATSSVTSSNQEKWLKYRLKSDDISTSVSVRLLKDNFSAEELFGFNNTGNVCIWPSEEVLAYYCCKHKDIFRNKRVLELGCGMSALAGFQIAMHTEASEILLTDGNETGVQNVEVMLEANKETFKNTAINCRVLTWQNSYDSCDWLKEHYDVIIVADCLFFVTLHDTLIKTLQYFLTNQGQCILMAPKRSGSLDKFVNLAVESFNVDVEHCYDDMIWEKHLFHEKHTPSYNVDLHFPVLVKLTRKNKTE